MLRKLWKHGPKGLLVVSYANNNLLLLLGSRSTNIQSDLIIKGI